MLDGMPSDTRLPITSGGAGVIVGGNGNGVDVNESGGAINFAPVGTEDAPALTGCVSPTEGACPCRYKYQARPVRATTTNTLNRRTFFTRYLSFGET